MSWWVPVVPQFQCTVTYSFSTRRISELVPDPNTRAPLTHRSFVSDVLPPILCYFAIALLSLLPDTFPLRVGLLPMALYSAFRAVTTIDVALSTEHSGLNYLNQAFSVSPFFWHLTFGLY
jgi:hypothetical protein